MPVQHVRVGEAPIDVAALRAVVDSPRAGAVVVFDGVVRDHDHGKPVDRLVYEAHPSAEDVLARMEEDWFDPAGFFLVEDAEGRLVAFHWTKVEDGEGEVYVVGVDPTRQGLGLGRAATAIGLRHLARAGLERVTLYVDGDNTAALATYRRLGFTRIALDVQYGRPTPESPGPTA